MNESPAGGSPRGASPNQAAESAAFVNLLSRAGAQLRDDAPALSERWARQVLGAGLWPDGEAVREELARIGAPIISAMSSSLAADGAMLDSGITRALDYGEEAFEAGASLSQALKSLNLLSAMVLYAVERVSDEETALSAGDGMRLARRLQQHVGLLTAATAEGYMQGVSDGMRDRFRHLRHDLRNPLGTIKSVLALMDDESVPADARANPRFRAMASRNARSLEEMIAARLADAAAMHPVLGGQLVSPRRVACAVRRDLRGESAARQVAVVVGEMGDSVRLDAGALQLLLHALLVEAFQEAPAGAELRLERGPDVNKRFSVTVEADGMAGVVRDEEARVRLRDLAARMQASIEFNASVTVSMLVTDSEQVLDAPRMLVGQERPVADAPAVRSDR